VAAEALAAENATPTLFLDPSAAASREVVSALPRNARLVLVEEGGRTVPLRRKADGQLGDLVVDGVDGALDLGDYLGSAGGDGEEDTGYIWALVLCVATVMGFLLWWVLARRARAPSPA
jgi:hypothetical protein